MSDGLRSHIRTWWPIALGQLTTLLVAFLAAKVGVEVSGEVAYAFVSAAVTALVYSLGRWLETRTQSWARRTGRLILSLGLNVGAPTYVAKAAEGTKPHRIVRSQEVL